MINLLALKFNFKTLKFEFNFKNFAFSSFFRFSLTENLCPFVVRFLFFLSPNSSMLFLSTPSVCLSPSLCLSVCLALLIAFCLFLLWLFEERYFLLTERYSTGAVPSPIFTAFWLAMRHFYT